MKRIEFLGAGFLFISLALVTVAVKVRVVRLERRLAMELNRVLFLEAEVNSIWCDLQMWKSPEGAARLKEFLTPHRDGRGRSSRGVE